MSDYDKLINKIHESLNREEESLPGDISLTVDENAAELPAPKEVESEGAEEPQDTAAEEASVTKELPVTEEAPAAQEENPAAAPEKKRSRFRKSDAGYVDMSNGERVSPLPSFADRYSVSSGDAGNGDSAFGRFTSRMKIKKFEKPAHTAATKAEMAVLDAAINGTSAADVSAADEAEETVTPAEDTRVKTSDTQEVTPAFTIPETTAFDFGEDFDGETDDDGVKVADKSEILRQLATADSEDLDDETLKRIERDVEETRRSRAEKEAEDDDGEDGEKKRFSFKNPFSAENLKNKRLRFAHLDPSLNRLKCGEYTDPIQMADKKTAVGEARKTLLLRTVAVAALFLVTVIMNIVAAASVARNGGVMGVFGGSGRAYCIACMITLALSAAAVFPELRSGVYAALRLKPKACTMLVCAYIAAFLQCFAGMFTKLVPENDFHILVAAVIAVSAPVLLAEENYFKSLAILLHLCEKRDVSGVLADVDDPDSLAEMLRDDVGSGKTLRFPALASFISDVMASGADASASAEIRGRIDAVFGVVSVICGIVAAIVAHSPVFGLTALAAALCLSLPVTAVVAGANILLAVNKAGYRNGIHVVSAGEAKNFVNSENIVLGDSDVFSASTDDILTVPGVSGDQMKLIAAILAKRAGGVLAQAFADIIEAKGDSFPAVSEFACENRLGVSGWISDCRVLLGNKAFMDSHSVDINADYYEKTMKKDTKKLYMSINGSFVACIALRYRPLDGVIENLRRLVKDGTNLIILATDPNLSDDAIEKMLSFPADSVRVLSTSTVEKFNAEKTQIRASSPAGVVFNPGVRGFMEATGYALDVTQRSRFINIMTIGMGSFALAVALIFSMTALKEGFSVWAVLLIQLVFNLAAYFLPDGVGGKLPGGKKIQVRPVKVSRHGAPRPVRNTPATAAEEENDFDQQPGHERRPAEDAPVYVAVSEEPDPVEASVNPARDENDDEPVNISALLEIIDEPEKKYIPQEKKTIFGKLSKKMSGVTDKAKTFLHSDDYVRGEGQDGGDEYGDYDDYHTPGDNVTLPPPRRDGSSAKKAPAGKSVKNAVKSVVGRPGGLRGAGASRPGRNGGRANPPAGPEKPRDYYNSGNISTGDGYDFVGRYSGDNMFSGLNEEDR